MTKLYTPPPGYIDLPFTWAFDGSVLTNGQNYQNNGVYLIGGYGDFILRRVVGLDRVLAANTGKYLLRDRNNKPWESAPVIVNGSADLMIAPEQPYPETGLIRFDLSNVLKQAVGPQIAFQGVRRVKGTPQPNEEVNPKTFTYQLSADMSALSAGGIMTGRVLVTDYPFLLEQIMVFTEEFANTSFSAEASATLTFSAARLGASGNTISVELNASAAGQTFAITVIGNSIVVTVGTDGGGNVTTTGDQFLAAFNANAAATALANVTVLGGASLLPVFVPQDITHTFSGGGFLNQITTPQVALWIYDQDRVKISNIPILDIFADGSPGGPLQNGALVTPLRYRKDSQIQIDFTLLTTGLAVVVYLIGKQIYPCS